MNDFLKHNFNQIDWINKEEMDQMPPILASERFGSWNTCSEDLSIIGNFIEKFQPSVVLECGTFEGRGTEYIARKMIRHSQDPKVLITIDAAEYIIHIDTEAVIYGEDPLWNEIKKIREARMTLLQRYQGIKVIPIIGGLVRDVLEDILNAYKIQFIYQDASHVNSLMIQEWKILEKSSKEKDLVICFDDSKTNTFKEWLEENVRGWHWQESRIANRGQLWMEQD